jgi:hypothetical protein
MSATSEDDRVVCRKPAGRKCDAYPSVVVLVAGPRNTSCRVRGAYINTAAGDTSAHARRTPDHHAPDI